MPTPEVPIITDYDHYEDGEFVGNYPIAHIPCPLSDSGQVVIEAISTRFSPVFVEYSNDDGGHVAVAVEEDDLLPQIIKLVEAVRDSVRGENGRPPYSPTQLGGSLSQDEARQNSCRSEDRPPYIH